VAPGADADLVLVNPSGERVLRNQDVLSKAGWTPFDGRRVRGQTVRTYLRGALVAEEGKPVGARGGRFVPGRSAAAG
jgi:dihydroorotase-like cyclic amidohydrolase